MSHIQDSCIIGAGVASGVATIDFTDPGSGPFAWSKYALIRAIFCALRPTSDAGGFNFRVSSDLGVSWKTSLYSWSVRGQETDGTVYGSSQPSIGYIRLMRSVGNAANEKAWGVLDIFDPMDAASFTTVAGISHFAHFSGAGRQQHNGGQYKVVTAINGLRFYFDSNMVSGLILLEGIRR